MAGDRRELGSDVLRLTRRKALKAFELMAIDIERFHDSIASNG
jgi:hypothetical protein